MRFSTLAISALALFATACHQERAESIRLTNRATQEENMGKRELAYASYAQAAKVDPTNHRAMYQMALIELFDKNEPERALPRLLQASTIAPDDRDVLFQLGRYYATAATPDYQAAIGYLDRTIALDPHYAPAHYYKGYAHLQQDQGPEADKALRAAISANPKYAPAWQDLGELYERYGQLTVAQEVYTLGLDYADEPASLLNGLGRMKMNEDKPREAIVQFEKALTQGGRADVLFNLAMAYSALNDDKNAYRYLGEFLNNSAEADAENIRFAVMMRSTVLEKLEKAKAEAQE